MYIDIHTHAFHPKIAAKAVTHLTEAYGIECEGSGSLDDLLAEELAAGIDRYTVLCSATAPAQVVPANNFAISIHNHPDGHSIAFGTLHPGYADWQKELTRLEENGIRALKLHPDFQGFRLDDPRFLPVFEACSGRFLILFHIGSETGDFASAPSSPFLLAGILRNFPHLDVIGAHFGGYKMWDHVAEVLGGNRYPNLWVDTSSTSPFVDKVELRRLFSCFAEERCFFGSDWPLYSPLGERKRLQEYMGFSDRHFERLLTNCIPLLDQYGLLNGSAKSGPELLPPSP